MSISVVLDTDSYKSSHFGQYPPDATAVSCYGAARKYGGPPVEPGPGVLPPDGVLWFGLRAVIASALAQVLDGDVDKAEEVFTLHGMPFNRSGWLRAVSRFDGGLPLTVSALPEGSYVPLGIPLYRVDSVDDPDLMFLASYVETALLRCWYPTSVATRGFRLKSVIGHWLDRTGDPSGLPFKLHDFGSRGASSSETAGIGGMAHLVNFLGTDTVAGMVFADRFYDAGPACGYSIPASEHGTMSSWGPDQELDAFRNMLARYARPGALFACVSDTYDFWDAVDRKWPSLAADLERSGATLVIRPDSGDPAKVVPEALRRLAKSFPPSVNGKGYLALPPCVRLIQGDGISEASVPRILAAVCEAGFSADNVAFGMGGELLQNLTRDTWSFAQKVSAVKRSGLWRDAFKSPVDDPGKKSLGGRLSVVSKNGCLAVSTDAFNTPADRLVPVYRDGRLLPGDNFQAIRQRAENAFETVKKEQRG